MAVVAPAKKLIGGSWRAIGARYGGRHGRSIKRWVDKGVLPRPDLTIQGRPYYLESTLDDHDRRRAAAAMSEPRREHPSAPRA